MSPYVLKTEKMSKCFGKTEVLRDIDLAIAQGEVCGLIGQNGAGKTTLLRLICGLMKPTTGTVHRYLQKPFVGYMPQSCRFDDGSTVAATVALFAKLKGGDLHESLKFAKALHLNLAQKVKHLSPGQQKKLQLILAMAGDPDLYILDEPTAGLDPGATFEMKNIIGDIHKKGKSILISSHILQDLDEICTSVAILETGSLAYNDRLESCYVCKTSPLEKPVLQALGNNYAVSADAAGTTLTVQIKEEQVPQFIDSLCGFHVRIYQVAPANVKTLVQHELHIAERGQRA